MRRRRWTLKEILLVVQRYHLEGPAMLARELGRSRDSVISQASRYGQRYQRQAYCRRTRESVPFESLLSPGTEETPVENCPTAVSH